MKRLLLLILGIPLLLGGTALVLIAVLSNDNEGSAPGARTATATTAPSRTSSPVPATSTPSAGVCKNNPDPATRDIVQVDSPTPGAALTSPFTVSGKIAAFEATFRITIFDAAVAMIADQSGHSAEGQTLSPFSEAVAFSVRTATLACLWVYENSARDGSPTHVIQIPITLQP